MVERARQLLGDPANGRGVAFLSFTNAAVDELEGRLRAFGILPTPLFPSFIGTFDRFLWQFFVAPFGIQECSVVPRLIPDKENWLVKPYDGAQPLPLRCFDRATGEINAVLAKEANFDVNLRSPQAYETTAKKMIETAKGRGFVDFDDVRESVNLRLADSNLSKRVGDALAARFGEIFVDEAQDCNPADLSLVSWLMNAGIAVKIICDPNQSIYKFRGGVTDELLKYAGTFKDEDRLPMSGNFRSSPAICSALVVLRNPTARAARDEPVGHHKDDLTPIQIISYSGTGVSAAIGREFTRLVRECGIPLHSAPVIASTRSSAAKAIGQPVLGETSHMTLLLATAVMSFHFAFAVGNRRDALARLHRVILLVQERIKNLSDYDDYLEREKIDDWKWRAEVIEIANGLRFDPFKGPEQWLERARTLLTPGLVSSSSIKQRLRSTSDLETALASAPDDSPPARTIHSVKGLEFPGVCVVLTSKTAGPIIDRLEGGGASTADEETRKIYVGCSRAERLLAIAIPKSRVSRLIGLLTTAECRFELHQIGSA